MILTQGLGLPELDELQNASEIIMQFPRHVDLHLEELKNDLEKLRRD